jgi:glycosyltransferase involved in cell wall biosynthesis
MKNMKLLICWFLACLHVSMIAELPIVVIIPSYNNARWCEKNLDSIFSQNYTNFRVIYIDDHSADATYDKVISYVDARNEWYRCTVIRNEHRCGALENLYYAIHSCSDWELVVLVDGDDWLSGHDVFQRLNTFYQQEDIWLTYGQFVEYPKEKIGFCDAIPQEVIVHNSFRQHGCPVSHLRTFYAWLFKKIKKEDLLYEGVFYPMTWDKAIMLPMLEMSGGRFKFIQDVLYVYNFANPINDCRVNGHLQAHLARVIFEKEPYRPLNSYEIPPR